MYATGDVFMIVNDNMTKHNCYQHDPSSMVECPNSATLSRSAPSMTRAGGINQDFSVAGEFWKAIVSPDYCNIVGIFE